MKNNRAIDGFENEKDFVTKLNKNKKHFYWKIINQTDNSNLYFIRVDGLKYSKLTKEKILPKSDVYVALVEINNDELMKRNYYLKESDKIKILEIKKKTGVSIKMNNTNYQIDKCSINKFIKRYQSKELFCGATIYSKNVVDFKKNHLVLKAANTTWRELSKYFKEPLLEDINSNTNFMEFHKDIFSNIQKSSYKRIKYETLNDVKKIDSLFKGSNEFDEPYCANWLLINNNLTSELPNNFYVTKGSSNGGKNPTVVFKPLR